MDGRDLKLWLSKQANWTLKAVRIGMLLIGSCSLAMFTTAALLLVHYQQAAVTCRNTAPTEPSVYAILAADGGCSTSEATSNTNMLEVGHMQFQYIQTYSFLNSD